MAENDVGKFCRHCSATVTDFTTLTDKQIIEVLRQTSGKLCGRLGASQLNRFLAESKKKKSTTQFPQLLTGLLLASIFNKSQATAKTINAEFIQATECRGDSKQLYKTASKEEAPRQDSLNNTIEGRVIDAQTKESLPFATVIIKDTKVGVSTDTDGKFKLFIPDSLLSRKITLLVMSVGYEKAEITVKQTDLPLTKEFFIIPTEPALIGEVVIVKKKKWWQFWKRK